LNIVVAELLAAHTVARHLGTTLLVLVITAATANAGLIPTSTSDAPIYDDILSYVTPLAIFWLLLRINLREALRAGLPMIGLFLVGSFGAAVGVLAAMWLLNGSETIGDHYRAIGGAFTGTYTGGSVNFNALALHYGLNKQAGVYGGITAVDNILTTVWITATIAMPRLLRRIWPTPKFGVAEVDPEASSEALDLDDETESVQPVNVAFLFAIGVGSLWVSEWVAAWLKSSAGISFPSIVVLTTIALLLAQVPFIQRQNGSQVMGLFAMNLFLAAIAALCDISALHEMGRFGRTLLIFASLVIAIHAVITFGAAALFRIDVDMAAIASQANIGGATTAVGVAKSLQRRDLVLPAVLVGSLGYAVGTYLGFAVAEFLL
jgi:uncharacterized membrane protein